jgi:hypothetical protein
MLCSYLNVFVFWIPEEGASALKNVGIALFVLYDF